MTLSLPAAAGDPPFTEHARGPHRARWIGTVDAAYAEMQQRIDAATASVRLETYILKEAGPAAVLAAALLRARQRGVDVRVLLDAFGAEGVHRPFLDSLRQAGIRLTLFNPQRWLRRSFRNHRKLLACDSEHAILGGFNIAEEYAGDGVTRGWCDTAIYVGGPIVGELERSFDAMFDLAPFTPGAVRRFRKTVRHLQHAAPRGGPVQLFVSGPATRGRPLGHSLGSDLRRARKVSIAAAYFLPSRTYRRRLYEAAARGEVSVLLAGRTDVPIARLAAQHLYGRLLERHVRIFEYQPQILHAKLLILDDVVYVGSANLDRRSLHINYELLLRIDWPELAADARSWHASVLARCVAVDAAGWQATRTLWRRILSYASYLLLARLDPLLARRGSRSLS
ncbi:MAG: phospholipase D-like domain-containing protein [Steroidobacteraceae bacterium]